VGWCSLQCRASIGRSSCDARSRSTSSVARTAAARLRLLAAIAERATVCKHLGVPAELATARPRAREPAELLTEAPSAPAAVANAGSVEHGARLIAHRRVGFDFYTKVPASTIAARNCAPRLVAGSHSAAECSEPSGTGGGTDDEGSFSALADGSAIKTFATGAASARSNGVAGFPSPWAKKPLRLNLLSDHFDGGVVCYSVFCSPRATRRATSPAKSLRLSSCLGVVNNALRHIHRRVSIWF
jgi:hypothetical protein